MRSRPGVGLIHLLPKRVPAYPAWALQHSLSPAAQLSLHRKCWAHCGEASSSPCVIVVMSSMCFLKSWVGNSCVCLLSFLLFFFHSFFSVVQQTLTCLLRADYVLSNELGAEAVFLKGHALVLNGERQSCHHYNTVWRLSARWLWSTEDTLFIKHLLCTSPPRHEDPHMNWDLTTPWWEVVEVVCVHSSSDCGTGAMAEPSHACLPSLGARKLTTQAKFWDRLLTPLWMS